MHGLDGCEVGLGLWDYVSDMIEYEHERGVVWYDGLN